jgi:hypothetical protein
MSTHPYPVRGVRGRLGLRSETARLDDRPATRPADRLDAEPIGAVRR